MMMGRLEFRVFGDDLGKSRDALRQGYRVRGHEMRDDLYLLGGDPARVFKLRDASALDLKRHVAREAAFDRWEALGCVTLPATGADLAATFTGLPSFDPARVHDAEAVVAAFVHAGHRAIPVRKERTQYEADGCLAEITRVSAGPGVTSWTVAIEGEDKAALEDLRQRLGLAAFQNVSYPQWLGALTHQQCH
jgi:hypothetical protein